MKGLLAANVFITKSRAAMDKLFFGESKLVSFKEKMILLDEEELKDSFIASPYKNDGILRFEYSFGKGTTKQFIKAQFLETKKVLEYVLMGNDPMARILESKVSELNPGPNYVVDDDGFSPGGNQLSANLKKLAESQKYYFAFGTGDDLNDWSGPYAMDLVNAVLKNDEVGTRMLEAIFVPNIGSQKLFSQRFQEEIGYEGVVNSFNEMVSRDLFVKASATESITNDEKDINKPILDFRIRNLLKTYISKTVLNPNVIVAIPNDLNKLYDNPKWRQIKGDTSVTQDKTLPVWVDLETITSMMGMQVMEFKISEVDASSSKRIRHAEISGDKTAINEKSDGIKLWMGANSRLHKSKTLMAPFFKFTAGLRSLDTASYAKQEFDLYEETDIKLLELWKELGLIEDSSKSAFVFGDIDHISNMLYLNNYDPADNKQGAIEGLERSVKFLFGKKQSYFTEGSLFDKDPGRTTSLIKYSRYNKRFIEEFNLRDTDNRSSSFGEKPSKEISDGLVFRHNISNPNVLALNYTVDKYIAALIGLDVYPDLSSRYMNSTTLPLVRDVAEDLLGAQFISSIIKKVEKIGTSNPDDEMSDISFLNILLTNPELNNEIISKVSKEAYSNEDLSSLTRFDLIAFIAFVRHLNKKSSNYDGVKLVTDKDRYDQVYTSMINRLKTFMVTLDIRTLPFFGQKFFLKRTCTVIGNNNSIIGFESNKRKAPYSGRYNIFGWTHVIEPDGAYSTFSLTREGLEEVNTTMTDQSVKDAVVEYLLGEIAKEEASPSKQGPPPGVKVSTTASIVGGILNLPGIRQVVESLAGQQGVSDPYNTRLRNLRELLKRTQVK